MQVVSNSSTFLISFSGHDLIIHVGIKISRKMQQLPFRKKMPPSFIIIRYISFSRPTRKFRQINWRMNDILEMNCRLTQMCGTNSDDNFFGWVMMSPFLFEPEQVLP